MDDLAASDALENAAYSASEASDWDEPGAAKDEHQLAAPYRTLLRGIGEDVGREGLRDTPQRAAKAFAYLTRGYAQDVRALVNGAIFESANREMVIIRDIEFYSLCEHHILPFFGKVHVAYLPAGKVIGLSKIPRIVEVFARRLQIQENLTEQIAACIQEILQPKGIAVIVEARHMCMLMRGVEKQAAAMTTSSLLGEFRDSASAYDRFTRMLARSA